MFAYGQTGSGKTYTMTGETDESNKGIIPRTVQYTFDEISRLSVQGWELKVTASFLEIYNETIRDLLVEDTDNSQELRYDIKQNKNGLMYVTNLITREVADPYQLTKLVEIANKNRAVGFSDLNQHSSRSHSICQLVIKGQNTQTDSTME